jgi:hypothetical protein
MAKKPTAAPIEPAGDSSESVSVNLAQFLSKKPTFKRFELWLIGDTPLITHAWSHKAKLEMLQKQVKAPKSGKEARDPQADFVSSLYEIGDGVYGFPAMGVKNCILSAAHKDKGIPRSVVQSALWIDSTMARTLSATPGAICDLPLLRIYGSQPEMREDMVRVGSGLNKTASLAYRGQFTTWAFRLSGRFNASVLNEEALSFLIIEAGASYGLGEWRPERRGPFGTFRLASAEESALWDAYAAGKGPLPVNELAQAAE